MYFNFLLEFSEENQKLFITQFMKNKMIIIDTKFNEYKVSKEIILISADIPRFVDISRSQTLLVVVYYYETTIYNIQNGQQIQELKEGLIYNPLFSEDENKIYMEKYPGKIMIWNFKVNLNVMNYLIFCFYYFGKLGV